MTKRTNALVCLIYNILNTEVRTELIDGIFKLEENGLYLGDEVLERFKSAPVELADANREVVQPGLGVKQKLVSFQAG